jgi:hypothetical protein
LQAQKIETIKKTSGSLDSLQIGINKEAGKIRIKKNLRKFIT